MIRTVTRLEFRDISIEKIKVIDLEFSYTNNEGIIKHKDRLWLPFNVAKKLFPSFYMFVKLRYQWNF